MHVCFCAKAVITVDIVATYGSETELSGGVKRSTLQLIEITLFSPLRSGCWPSVLVRFIVNHAISMMTASCLEY